MTSLRASPHQVLTRVGVKETKRACARAKKGALVRANSEPLGEIQRSNSTPHRPGLSLKNFEKGKTLTANAIYH